ncbi:MAG: hypothetical protein HZC42_15060 [Candidatus Eisenbacteria bacterium]|nr:hypothetical protein [Candidatus Eisenbacteria bacterium]
MRIEPRCLVVLVTLLAAAWLAPDAGAAPAAPARPILRPVTPDARPAPRAAPGVTPQAPVAYRLSLSDFVMDEVAPGERFHLKFKVQENGTCTIYVVFPVVILEAAGGRRDTIQDINYEGALGYRLACDELRGAWGTAEFEGRFGDPGPAWQRLGIWFDRAEVRECHWYPLAARLNYRIKPE